MWLLPAARYLSEVGCWCALKLHLRSKSWAGSEEERLPGQSRSETGAPWRGYARSHFGGNVSSQLAAYSAMRPSARRPDGGVALALALLFVRSAESALSANRDHAFIGYKEQAGSASVHDELGFRQFVITTSYGEIRITPRHDLSPKIVELIKGVADKPSCESCRFYRHEPAPENFGRDGFYGPPYALLQGSLADMADTPPFEGSPEVKRGDVCLIPNCKEFFIATSGHEEWGHAHSVWGHIADAASWEVIGAIPVEPFTTITDKGGITTRWLTANAKIPFQLTTR
ncbi:hypothetical protein FOA52_000178 [Chlamydomonas sp. UWO 241]|nr:hypothetical protein FOA52_000178 [Chlamydomonas sp. UWO 241]